MLDDDTNPLANIMITRFPNSFETTPWGDWNLEVVLQWIKDGMYAYEINRVRQVLTRNGKRDYDRVKAHLQAFTFAGTFYPTRGNAHLQRHSGIFCGDLDRLLDVEAAKRNIFSDQRTLYGFTSPSATGLKIGVRGPTVADDAEYKRIWQLIATEYEQLYGVRWDPSGKDVSRLCYASYDPDLYTNFNAEVFDVPPTPAPVPRPQPQQPSVSRSHTDHQDYAKRAVQTAMEMIQSAQLGTRHHTRLKAARLLGGYVAGGLLSEDQAYGALAQALGGHTEHLERALKTVEDGLAYGQAHPITIEALQAERQAWLDAYRQPRQHTVLAKSGIRTIAAEQVLARGGIRTVAAKEVAAWRR